MLCTCTRAERVGGAGGGPFSVGVGPGHPDHQAGVSFDFFDGEGCLGVGGAVVCRF